MGEKSEERAPPWVTWSKKGKPCKGATNRGDLCHARFGADRICVYLPRALLSRPPASRPIPHRHLAGLACQRPLAYAEELSPNGGSSQAVNFGETTLA